MKPMTLSKMKELAVKLKVNPEQKAPDLKKALEAAVVKLEAGVMEELDLRESAVPAAQTTKSTTTPVVKDPETTAPVVKPKKVFIDPCAPNRPIIREKKINHSKVRLGVASKIYLGKSADGVDQYHDGESSPV